MTNKSSKQTKGEWFISHSPTALKNINKGILRCFKSIKNQNAIGGKIIANAFGDSKEEAEANAERIVKAVNMHDELIKIVKEYKVTIIREKICMTQDEYKREIDRIESLLKQAE